MRRTASSADILDFPSNTTIQFTATRIHVSTHYRSIIRLSNKNSFLKGKHAHKVCICFVFMRPEQLRQVTTYAFLMCQLIDVISLKHMHKNFIFRTVTFISNSKLCSKFLYVQVYHLFLQYSTKL
jgi:hypothetical protein